MWGALFIAFILPQDPSEPSLVTEATRTNPGTLRRLETPGTVLFRDDFSSASSLEKYFEVRGKDTRRVVIENGCLRLTALDNNGREAGSGINLWFGEKGGYDRVHFRYRMKFAENYDQGNLNHTGGALAAVSGSSKWDGMGNAGIRPQGDDRCTVGFEPWIDYRRNPAPGYLFSYCYWMDMKRDRDGNYWGNMLGPDAKDRFVPKRGQWITCEIMMKLNRPGAADGELATWVDGKLYTHHTGIRWRSSDRVKIKRAGVDVYIHQSRQDNTVWYDDLAVSTGYLGLVR